MPTPLDHATGLEKKEMLAALAGIDDPYHNKPIKRGPSTKDNPTMVPSAFDARIIGCICTYRLAFLFIRKNLLNHRILTDLFSILFVFSLHCGRS